MTIAGAGAASTSAAPSAALPMVVMRASGRPLPGTILAFSEAENSFTTAFFTTLTSTGRGLEPIRQKGRRSCFWHAEAAQ